MQTVCLLLLIAAALCENSKSVSGGRELRRRRSRKATAEFHIHDFYDLAGKTRHAAAVAVENHHAVQGFKQFAAPDQRLETVELHAYSGIEEAEKGKPDLHSQPSGGHPSFRITMCIAMVCGIAAMCCQISNLNPSFQTTYSGVQALMLSYDFLLMASVTATIPEAYRLTVHLGFGATTSGWLIGSAWPMAAIVSFCAKPLVTDWVQSRNRSVLLSSYVLQACAELLFAAAADPPLWLGTPDPIVRFSALVVSRLVLGTVAGLNLILSVMTWRIVPCAQIVRLEILKTCSRFIGIGFGPLLSSLCCFVSNSTHANARVAYCSYALIGLWSALCFLAWCTIPASLEPLIEAKKLEDADVQDPSTALSTVSMQDVESLSSSSRRRIWLSAVCYGIERAFIVSALESATALILELEFGFSTRDSGLAIALAFFMGLFVLLAGDAVRRRGWILDVRLIVVAGLTTVGGSILLFPGAVPVPGGKNGINAVLVLLIADSLIFAAGYFVNGMLDGLAVRSCCPESFWSLENFKILESFLQDSVARVVGPPVARYLISVHGRDVYSITQVCVSSLGFLTCLSVVHLLRRKT